MQLRHDRRGQSVVIGTVILFGFLILALSLYQVQVVPQQNAQAEFQHFEEVQNDLVELRAGILQAGSTDQPQYQTVRLGMSYSTRLFAINPPAPAGTIRTVESPYPITISNGSGTPEGTVMIPTRFIQYRPGYNEIDQSPTWYDASVLYVDGRDDSGGIAVIEDQALVDSGEVEIVALQNEFRRSGTGRVTLELRPAENITDTLPEGNLTVTVPTRLSESDWETNTDLLEEINSTDSDIYGGVTDTGTTVGIDDSKVYNLTLNTSASKLTVDTVGVQEVPEDPSQDVDGAVGGNDDASRGDEPNNDADSVQTVDASPRTTGSGNSGKLIFDISSDTEVEISAAGIETRNNLAGVGADPNSRFIIAGNIQSTTSTSVNGDLDYQFSPSVTISATGDTKIEFDNFDTGIQNVAKVNSESNADIIVSLQFSDGSVRDLFFSAEKRSSGGSSNGNGKGPDGEGPPGQN